jgi:hypothetical protein
LSRGCEFAVRDPGLPKLHFNEMVDPNYVVVASIEKKYLPKRK